MPNNQSTPAPLVSPALSAEEWQEWREDGCVTRDGRMILHSKGVGFRGVPRISCLVAPMDTETHAAAAVLLDQQPYGFSWEDVDMLLNNSASLEVAAATYNYPGASQVYEGRSAEYFGNEAARYRDLADRIAALLPPQDTTGARE